MKKLNLDEIHEYLLGLAKTFDEICTKHKIPYYMLGGTMLGAVRHKGFIPWDDDMDFGVPRFYYQKLIHILETELPVPYHCATYTNHPAIRYPFIKIEDTSTCIDDPRISLPLDKQLGINIDIFPLDECSKDDKKIKKIFLMKRTLQLVYVEPPVHSTIKKIIKRILRFFCPLSLKSLNERINNNASSLEKGDCLANILGRWKEKEIIPTAWYGEGTRYPFENITLCGLKEYDKYLVHMYKDYMKIPPKNQQLIHTEHIYQK